VDILIHPEVITFLEQNPLLLIGGRYVLMELPNHSIPPRIPDFFFKMRLRGYIPIITHPERNHMVQRDPEVLAELVKVGALFQVTAMSLTGEFGEAAHESVTRLIRSGLVHSIATDAHSPRRRPPVLSKARQFLEEMIGRDQAAVVMDQVPEKILRGEVVEGGQITESPRRYPSLLSRLFKRKI
jgi:protein-tyrosine phosphatase